MEQTPNLLVAKDIWKQYGPVSVLKGVSLEVSRGELVSIVGPSGAGKSTLLYIVSSLEKADDKVIQINGPANITIDNYICDQGAGKCFRVNGNAKKDNKVNVKVGKLHAKDVKWIFTSGKTLSGVKDKNTTCRIDELWVEGGNKLIFDCEKAKTSYGKLYKKS